MKFEKTGIRYIKLDSEVFFVSNNEVLKGKVMDATIKLDFNFNLNKYTLLVDEIYDYHDIYESDIYFSKEFAEKSISDVTTLELGQRNDYSFIELLHLPIEKQVIFKFGNTVSQGIISEDSYVIINDSEELDITYGIDLIHKKNHCVFCSILDIVS